MLGFVAEIKRRIALAKSAFQKLDNILRNGKMSMSTRFRVLNCYVYPVLCYGSEALTLTVYLKKRLEICEMWFLRISNEEVLARAGVNRRLIKDIRVRQMRFLGHVLLKEEFENLALTGKIEGKRSKGRQRILRMNCLAGWIR